MREIASAEGGRKSSLRSSMFFVVDGGLLKSHLPQSAAAVIEDFKSNVSISLRIPAGKLIHVLSVKGKEAVSAQGESEIAGGRGDIHH
jgi:hypothetical protein